MTTRDRIIESTASLIRNRGYFGTGINEIIKDTSVPKGSLYHHFPGGKDEMISSALEVAALGYAEEFKNAMKGKPNAVEGLKAIVDLYIHGFGKGKQFTGCPLAAVSMDISGQNEHLRKTCARLFTFWIDSTASYLEYKGVKNARPKAESFMIRLEGAIMMSQAQQSARPLQIVKNEIHSLLK